MAKVLDVKEYIEEQTQLHKERRTSQHILFVNKTPCFPDYYPINKILSTSEYTSSSIDSYIGKDSPVRFDKIDGLPIYGFPEVTTQSDFDELLGSNSEGYEGTATIVPGIIEPSEGDCFILKVFSSQVLFIVNKVEEITLKAKPHFSITFHIDSADKIHLLERQVAGRYTAIFDNIGTENRVIIENEDFKEVSKLRTQYKILYDYYINKFFRKKTTTFETWITLPHDPDEGNVRFIDKFLQKFLQDNRVIILDSILKETLMVDFNGYYDQDDFLDYEDTIFYALEHNRMDLLISSKYIFVTTLDTPFSLYRVSSGDKPKISNKYLTDEISNQQYIDGTSFIFDLTSLVNQIKDNEIANRKPVDNIYNILVKYFNNIDLSSKDFDDMIYLDITDIEMYIYFPLVMFIIGTIIKTKEANVSSYLTI